MTAAVLSPEVDAGPARWRAIWIGAFALALLLYFYRDELPWADAYPKDWQLPLGAWTTAAMAWFIDPDGTFFTITRAITAVLYVPLQFAFGVLHRGFDLGIVQIPRLSWVGVGAAAAIVGHLYGGWRLAASVGACFLYLAVFGQWNSAMLTLALIVICVPLGVAIGLLLGIWGYRSPRANTWIVVPLLDLSQAMPAFGYLVPMLMLFGINPVSAMLATLVFAAPPMVRATTLALSQVPGEVRDFGHMAGCTRRQHMWRILVPSARPLLMVGVNQVIMMSLNMVIITSMIGAGGLGYDVLLALRALKVGASFEAGLAIVLLAIVLDRLSQAAAARKPAMLVVGQSFWRRHPHLGAALAVLALTTAIATVVPFFGQFPKSLTVTTAPFWDHTIAWIVRNLFDPIEAVRTALLLNVLNPIRAFMLGLPWLAVVGLLGLAGITLGGLRLAALVVALTLFCAVSGLWEKTVITVYLVGVSAVFACLVGMPLGVWASRNETVDRAMTVIVDTLQTIPAFVYLIPAVMLFRVGDVAAMMGIVLYAVTPAIRYTNHGIRQVAPGLIEAATVSGCTRSQILWRVQVPLALPEIMLGVNQVVFLALSMDIIAAMIGTRDLGQEVFIALAKADPGRGIVAALAVACIGIVADRLIGAWSARVKRRLGIG